MYIAGIFGTGILNNLHLRYLRGLGKDVVLIHNLANSGATGFLVKGKSGKTYVMTNNHVCNLEKSGTILGTYQGDTYVLNVIKRYSDNDLCALSAPSTAKGNFGIAKNYSLGEQAFAIGHPLLEPLSISSGELSDLIMVSIAVEYNGAPESCVGPTYSYQTDLPPEMMIFGVFSVCVRSLVSNTSSIVILPGNSGSAIVNIWGNVIGVAYAANEYGTRSYVVPLSYLKDFLSQL